MNLRAPGAAYAAHGLAAALAAGLLLVAILGWNDLTDTIADNLFEPKEGTESSQADTWVRVGLAVIALALLAVRGVWADVVLVVVLGLVVSALFGSGHATYDTYAKPSPEEDPARKVAAEDVRVTVPADSLTAPPSKVPRDAPARLVAVVNVRDEDGQIRIEARRHEVTPRQTLAADEAPGDDVLVDVARGSDDETASALLADIEAAQAIYLLPD